MVTSDKQFIYLLYDTPVKQSTTPSLANNWWSKHNISQIPTYLGWQGSPMEDQGYLQWVHTILPFINVDIGMMGIKRHRILHTSVGIQIFRSLWLKYQTDILQTKT